MTTTGFKFPIKSTQYQYYSPGSSSANNGVMFAMGPNDIGQLGLGDTTSRSSPVQVGSFSDWKQIGGSTWFTKLKLGVKNDGTLWAWGRNDYGQLGLGDRTHRSSPVQVGSLTNWKQVAGGGGNSPFSAAIKTDGTLWTWGYNAYLGLGTITNYSSPVQVGALTNWKQVACGDNHAVAVKTDGTIWSWGAGDGQLGLGDTSGRSSPVQIGTLTNWSQVSAAYRNSFAVKTDGTIWSWGFNDRGQLGLGDITHRSSPVQIGSLTNWKQVVGNYGAGAAVKTNGTLWTWGANYTGQLGQSDAIFPPTVVRKSSPVQVGALTNWSQVFSDGPVDYFAAVKTDGTLWTWGRNDRGELGLGDITHRSSPVQVGTLTSWITNTDGYGSSSATSLVAAGTILTSLEVELTTESFFVSDGNTSATSGALWMWGENTNGQLGLGDRTHRSTPVLVGALTNWKQVSGGETSNGPVGAVKTDGTLWTWGRNENGNLGLGDITHRSSPVQVGALTNWKQVSVSVGSLAVKTDGTLWAWGRNSYGRLGLGNITDISSPVQVGALTNWSSVSISAVGNSLAVKTDGTLWAWGNGRTNVGLLGLGDTTHRSSPVQVGALTNWSSVTGSCADGEMVMAVKTDGTLWAWGYNNFGELGLGDRTNRSSPVQVGSLTNWSPSKVYCGQNHTVAVKTDGTLWTWGLNGSGQLGQGNTTRCSSPVQVGSLTNWKSPFGGGQHSGAVKTDGTIWTWGYNYYGQLGQGDTTNKSSPVQIGTINSWVGERNFASGGSTAAIASGTFGTRQIPATITDMDDMFVAKQVFNDTAGLWTWGLNYAGVLGLGDRNHRSFPVQMDNKWNWKEISSNKGNSRAAIKTDGTLWTWGANYSHGNLGLGDRSHRSSPVQVGALSDWKQISMGGDQTIAIKTNGTLWGWGGNLRGELGLSNNTSYSSPIQISSLTNWKQVSGGSVSTAAIKTDGTLWTWGYNSYGELGQGNTTHYSSPVQVGALTNWKLVSCGQNHNAAVKTDGTLWSWGRNTNGELGLGDRTSRSSPTQVGSLTNWKQVSCGDGHTAAVKTDGTLWTWGLNGSGQLGLGDRTHRSTPVLVGALTNWNKVSAGNGNSIAIKTDGTLWTWGVNYSGRLGLNDTSNRSSPVQVGLLYNWKQISGSEHTSSSAIST
jgi:alpha-tubulin suppressor-like RCC1 family protein